MQDAVGNYRYYDASTNPGPASLTVKSNADVVPPEMTAIRVVPTSIDVSDGRKEATVEVDVTDDASGVAYVSGYFASPSGRQGAWFSAAPVAGQPGVTRGTTRVARYSEPGAWKLEYLCAADKANNQQCLNSWSSPTIFPAALEVISNPADGLKPAISNFRVNPSGIDVTNGPQSVNVDLDVTDELSGVQYAYVGFRSPRTAGASPEVMYRYAWASAPSIHSYTWHSDGTYSIVEDDSKRMLSGTISGQAHFPRYDRSGDWEIHEVCVIDQVNWVNCYTADTTPSIGTLGPTKVTVKWNRAPVVTVTGVTEASYEEGSEPTPGCEVNDVEDGTIEDVSPTVSRDGNTVTVTCTYTDKGIDGHSQQTGTHSVTYTVTSSANTAPEVHVTGVTGTSYEIGSEPAPACHVVDAEDDGEAATPHLSALSGALAAHGLGTRTVTCSYTDLGGLTGTATVTYEVVDTIAPRLIGTPTTAANTNGWFNAPVTIEWTVTDDGAGVDPASIPKETLISGDGAGLTVSASVVDRAGNTASASSPAVNIDKTAPAVVFSGNDSSYTIDEQVTIGCSATDALSGIASSDCPTLSASAWSLPLGLNTLSATATDLAGNTTNTSATFQVDVTTASLCELVKRFSTKSGVSTSLCQKLANAQAAADRGNTTAEAGIVSAFVNEVTAQSGKAFTETQAQVLNTLARAL